MHKAALTLLVGLMLSVSGSAWGATTLKDGIFSLDNLVRDGSDESLSHTGTKMRDLFGSVVCSAATESGAWKQGVYYSRYVLEAKRRGLNCGVGESGATHVAATSTNTSGLPRCPSNQDVYWHNCFGTFTLANGDKYVGEFKDNKLNGQGNYTFGSKSEWAGDSYVGEFRDDKFNGQGTYTFANGDKYVGGYKNNKRHGQGTFTLANGDKYVVEWKADKTNGYGTAIFANGDKYVGGFKDNKLNGQGTFIFGPKSEWAGDKYVGVFKDGMRYGLGTYTFANGNKYVGEWNDDKYNGQGTLIYADGRTAKEGIWKGGDFQYAKKLTPSGSNTQVASSTNTKNNTPTSAELLAAQRKALQLEQELAALKASKAEDELKIAWDDRAPSLNVDSRQKDDATVVVFGRARDNTGIADLLVNNDRALLAADGSFETSLYIPPAGLKVEIVAYDQKGNKATETLLLKRSTTQVLQETRFAQLQPSLGKRGLPNKNALALIVGIENYENLPARPSIHADNDAEYFSDFAHYKLGIPRNNIIKAINADAKRLDILKAITKVTKLSTKDETDVFIFFAGHGLAADDGEDVFLMPHDGDKDYLEATAMTRSEIFQLVERIGPKSVTVFLDACYTGGTRSQDVTLVASKRPIQVVALEQSVPSGFTILSASAADETSMALEAANHGLFSYFLMKGMEGDADADNDDKITMAEMRDYVKDKVVRQSDFQQTPELQGDTDRVLVQFQ